MRKLPTLFIILLLPIFVFAKSDLGLAGLSDSMNTVIDFLVQSFSYILLISGVFFILGSMIKYQNHRMNPSQIRLGEPVFLLVFGLCLLALPFFGYLVGYDPGFF